MFNFRVLNGCIPKKIVHFDDVENQINYLKSFYISQLIKLHYVASFTVSVTLAYPLCSWHIRTGSSSFLSKTKVLFC